MTDTEREAFLLELHKVIEAAADEAAKNLLARGRGSLTYPPGTRGLAAAERGALETIEAPAEALAAARKVVASAVGGAVYDALALLDGAREPEGVDMAWPGFRVERAEGAPRGTLHRAFKDAYPTWRSRRPDPGWTLD